MKKLLMTALIAAMCVAVTGCSNIFPSKVVNDPDATSSLSVDSHKDKEENQNETQERTALESISIDLLAQCITPLDEAEVYGEDLFIADGTETATLLTVAMSGSGLSQIKSINLVASTGNSIDFTYDGSLWSVKDADGETEKLCILRIPGEYEAGDLTVQISGTYVTVEKGINLTTEGDFSRYEYLDSTEDSSPLVVTLMGRHYLYVKKYYAQAGSRTGETSKEMYLTSAIVLIPLEEGFGVTLTADDFTINYVNGSAYNSQYGSRYNVEFTINDSSLGTTLSGTVESQTRLELTGYYSYTTAEAAANNLEDGFTDYLEAHSITCDDGSGNTVTLYY